MTPARRPRVRRTRRSPSGQARSLVVAAVVAGLALAPAAAALGAPPHVPPARVPPDHRLILGASRVDVLLGGRLVGRVERPPGVVEISWLVGRVPADWVAGAGDGTVRLKGELSLGRGAALEVGPRTSRLELVGGADPRASSGISVQGGNLQLLGTTVASVDPRTGRPVPAGQPGRPGRPAGAGGRVDLRDSRVTGLGDGTTGARSAGLFLGPGATGSVLRSTFAGNGIGLALAQTQAVSLSGVTVTGSATDGLLLRGDAGTTLASVTSTDNGRDGVVILGGDGRRIGGLRTERNQRFGVRAARLRDLALTGLRSVDDAEGALLLVGCRSCVLDDPGVQGGRVGLRIGAASGPVRVTGGVVRGAAFGVQLAPTAGQVTLTGLTVNGATRVGVEIGGSGAALHGVQVSQAGVGVRVYGQAAGALLDQVTVTGGRDGIVATDGTRGLTVTGPTVTGVSGTGLRLASTGLTVRSGTVRDAAVGAALPGAGHVAGLRISGVARGIWVGERGRITAQGVDVLATRTGIEVDRGGTFDLSSSRVVAARALVGEIDRHGANTIALPPFPWFGLAALVAVLLAFGLEAVHRFRAGRSGPPRAPDHVLNVT
ncbi:right-handed parallel beta-helix repeat-containing protein [Frankia sp. AgW1.1]|uniref:right-handed parallel beta-helix repeat-containing protein n=1 Tax=Frankia sp. AgW1.1 TaxID=1836971 RepID=UPI0019325D60|nr:right-handed parallel beta-helix repeat-containing protein [Frankia sp. AgW1.1]MBL7491957.1 right-handed parallel beta-helix repeat-containing protein [Frankia sp. AgW1.1]